MALTQTIDRFHIAVLAGVLAILGTATACSDLDPVKVMSKCEGPDELDPRCPQCQTAPFAAECPSCQQSAPDPALCLPHDVPWMDPALAGSVTTLSDGGLIEGEAGGQSPDGPGGTSGPSSGSGGDGSSGPNTPNEGEPGGAGSHPNGGSGAKGGSGAEPMAGQMAPVQRPSGCLSDADCTPSAPACRGDGNCTECIDGHHCPNGMQCNTNNHCVGCVNDEPCTAQGKVCLLTEATCVQCNADPDCPMETPACTTNHECVKCTESRHCPVETPTCSANTCVECERDPDCTRDGKRVCITDEQRCVECKADPDCRGTSGRSRCATADNTCVACLTDSDCSDPSASQCDPGSHSCVPCTATTHCAQFKGSTSQCANGECVVCDRQGGSCGSKACILSTNTCSTKTRNSVAACDECASSDECIPGHVCVPTKFESYDTGNRCLPNYADYREAGKPCPRPFSRKVMNVDTVEAFAVETLCSLTETTSCPALLDALSGKDCMDNNRNCGVGQYDGYCGMDGCSYHCTSDDYCPNSKVCSKTEAACL